MTDEPDIIKKLKEEEKLGTLHGQPQGSYEELEIPEELPKNTSDESDEFFKEKIENGTFNTELTQHGSSSVDERELLFQSTSDLMLYLDKHGKIAKINKAGIAFSGFSGEEVIGKHFWKLHGVFSKRNLPTYLTVFKNVLKGKPTESFLSELHEKSGRKHIMKFSTYPIKQNGKVKYLLVVAKDITEQKKSEDKYRLIAETTSDLISIATFSFKPVYTYISPSNTRLLGYEPEELIGKNCFDFLHPDDRKNLTPLLKKYISMKTKKLLTGKEHEIAEKIEFRFRNRSGNWHYLESTVNIIGNKLLFVSKDITEQKKKEDELDSERKQMLSIFDSMDEIIYVSDPKTYEILYVNPAMQKTFNKKLLGETCYRAFQNKDAPCEFCTNHIIFKDENKDKPYRWEFHNSTVDRDYSITDRVIKWPDGRDVRFELAVDITEHKKMDDRFRMIANVSTDLIYEWDVKNDTLEWFGNFDGFLGYKEDEIPRTIESWVKFIHPDDLKKLKDSVELHRKSTVPIYEEYRIRKKDGAWLYWEDRGTPVLDGNGLPVKWIGGCANITERKNAEDDLRESEMQYRNLIKNNPAAIAIHSEGKVVFINKTAQKLMNIKKEEEILGKPVLDFVHPDYKRVISERMKKIEVDGEFGEPDEEKFIKLDGKEIDVSVTGNHITYMSKPAVQIVFTDITERKKAKEMLKESEEKYRLLAENSIECIWKMDTKLRFTYLSPSLEGIMGFKPEQWVGTKISSHFKKREFLKVGALATKAIANYKTFTHVTFETKMLNSKNEEVDVEISSKVLLNSQGKLIGLQGTTKDITERKKAEETIQGSENRFKNLFENMSSGVAVYEAVDDGNDFVFKDFNRAGEKIDGVKRKDILGKRVTDAFPGVKDFGLFEVFQRVWKTGKPEHHPISLYKDDRIARWRENYVYKIPSGEIVAVYNDVTEQKRAEEEVRKAKSRMELIVNTAPSGLFTVNLDREITSWSPTTEKISGIKVEDAIGKKCTEIWNCPACLEKCRLYDKDTEKPIFSSECTITTPKGKEFTLSKNVDLLRNETGEIVGGIESFVDITERKKAEDKIKRKTEALEKANAKAVELVGELQTSYGKLEKKIDELERYKKATVNRELKMIELKKRIKKLEGKLEKEVIG